MKITLISMLLLLAVMLTAAPVSQAVAEQAARNWTAVWAPQGYEVRSPQRVTPLSLENEIQLYLFEYNDGFVVTSADDALKPVLAYGFETVVNGLENNPSLRDHLYTLMQEAVWVKSQQPDNSETAVQWRDVLNNNISRHGTRSVNPLITTRWNQDWPYNMYCPEDAAGPGGHVYVGCVATAMAQVAKYWNWPVTGQGSHSYYAYGYGNQSVNFGSTNYQWAQMPISVSSPNEAVARLSYHLGVSVDMMYAPDGSGAYSQDVPEALISHFRFDSGTQYRSRSSYTMANWEQLLRDQLDGAKPMYYSGSGPGGGHAFNLDGYQNNNYFHFNWGWGGSYDGYYYVTNLNPGYTFNNNQGAVVNIIPVNYSISSVGMALSGYDCGVEDNAILTVVSNPIMPEWNVTDISFVIEFDDAGMVFNGIETVGTMLEGVELTAQELQPGRIQVSGEVLGGLSGGGNLLKLKFQPLNPGNYAFNLADFNLNTTEITQLTTVSINVTAQIMDLQNSVLDILNAMYIPFDTVASIPLNTTFLLPGWNVSTAGFVLNYQPELVTWEGYDAVGCLAENASIEVTNEVPGQLVFSIGFGGTIVGGGTLLKFKFRAAGNTDHVALATLTLTNFMYNQTAVTNLQPGYIVLLPVTPNEDDIITPQPGLVVGPNPFRDNASLTITAGKASGQATANVYNLKGQLVRKLFEGRLNNSTLNLVWDGEDDENRTVPAGVYLLKVKAEGLDRTVKLIRLK